MMAAVDDKKVLSGFYWALCEDEKGFLELLQILCVMMDLEASPEKLWASRDVLNTKPSDRQDHVQ